MAATVDAKLLRQTKFPPEFNTKVDMKKVNIEVMKKWIGSKISEILGNEDDVVIELCFNLLEGSRFPSIKQLQIQLTGFLDKDTPKFCKDLWDLCLSAQSNPQGVPKELLEAKKLELMQEKLDAEKAVEEARRQKEAELSKEKEIDRIRQRERDERGRGGRHRRGVGSRDFGRRNFRDSRSPPPPPRRWSPDRYGRDRRQPRFETYVPSGRWGSRQENGRGRRPSRAISRSPSASHSRSPSSSRSRSRSRSRSVSPARRTFRDRRSPERRRQRSLSRSRSPTWRNSKRRRRESPLHNDRRSKSRSRSRSRSGLSRSRSPRKSRRRSLSSSSRSVSRSPPSRYRRNERLRNARRRSFSRSLSRSRSPSKSRSRSRIRSHSSLPARRGSSGGRWRRSPSNDSRLNRKESRADVIKDRTIRDSHRLSRSRDRRERQPRSRSRSLTRSSTRHSSPSRNRSRSRDRLKRRRHQSIERYAPAARRQRKDSPISSPKRRKDKTDADSDAEEQSKLPARPQRDETHIDEEPAAHIEDLNANCKGRLTATELREKLLREKVKALRRSNATEKSTPSS